MISKTEIESDFAEGEVIGIENESEYGSKVKMMVSCRNGCSGALTVPTNIEHPDRVRV